MLAEFSICPLDQSHMSKDVAKVITTLKGTGLNYRLGPMGTSIEGDWEQVIDAIRRCHQAVASDHERVVTIIMIDDHKGRPHSLAEMVSCVEQQVGT